MVNKIGQGCEACEIVGRIDRMKINRNMSAVMTNKQLLRTENRLAASMQRLSSGLKINKAGDNPAGIAISNKMKAQIDALDQAESNASDGIAVMQIADGALNEVSAVLQRMRELSVQAANGTYERSDRESIQKEIDQLRDEVDRISSNTEYNTKTLLDGSSDTRVYAENASRIYISDNVVTGNYQISVTEAAQKAVLPISFPAGGTIVEGDFSINGVDMIVTGGMTEEEFFDSLKAVADEAGCELEHDETSGQFYLYSGRYGSNAELDLSMSKALAEQIGMNSEAGVTFDETTQCYNTVKSGVDAVVSIPTDREASGFSGTATAEADGNRITISDLNGFSIDFLLDENYELPADADLGEIAQSGNFELEVTDIGTLSIQIGANQYQTMAVRIPEVSVDSLYLDTIDVRVKNGPEHSMVVLDEAIAKLSENRSRIGAFQNRLEYAESSLAETQENVTSAYSNLLDTDMAEEMTEYTQQNILDQATISVLSQANDMPQQVLSLLRQ